MAHAARVVVAGNGALGLATAWRLAVQAPDVEVIVVGPAEREGGASQAAGAMLGHFGEISKRSLMTEPGRQKFGLGSHARRLWPTVLQELGAFDTTPLLVAEDTFVLLNGRSGALDSENYSALLSALWANDEPHEEVDEVPGIHPVPDARPLRAVRLPSEGAVDGRRVLAAMESAARAAGGTVVDGRVASIRTAGGRVAGVRLSDGSQIDADTVVMATGAFAGSLLADVLGPDAVLPMLSGTGTAFVTRRVIGDGMTSVVRSINRAGSCGLHLVPLGGGREYVGATNVIFGSPQTEPHLGAWQSLLATAVAQLDQRLTYSRIESTRIGNRPVTLDTYPVLGPTSLDGLLVLSGTYRDGLMLSPAIADLAVQTITSGRSAFPDVFSPERDPHLVGSAEGGIDELVLHAVSHAYEAGTHLSPFIDSNDLGALFRPRAQALFRNLGLTSALPPEVAIHMVFSRDRSKSIATISSFLKARKLVA